MTTIDATAGALFVACLLSALLFGVTCTQAVHYFQTYTSDSWFIVLVVSTLLVLDITLMILAVYGSYIFVVGSIGDPTGLLRVPRTFTAMFTVSLTSVFLVRGFFMYRIWLLSNRSPVASMLNCLLLFGTYGLGLYAISKTLPIRSTSELANLSWETYSILCPGIVVDVSIASALCYYLFRSRNTHPRTNSLLNKLAAYTINTGVLTVIWDLGMIAAYATSRHTLIFIIFFLSISKLYINALLASLNSRSTRRARFTEASTNQLSELRCASRSKGEGYADPYGVELESAPEPIDIRLPAATDADVDDFHSKVIEISGRKRESPLSYGISS